MLRDIKRKHAVKLRIDVFCKLGRAAEKITGKA